MRIEATKDAVLLIYYDYAFILLTFLIFVHQNHLNYCFT